MGFTLEHALAVPVTGVYYEQLNRHPGFTLDESLMIPLNSLWEHSQAHSRVQVFVDPGIGRRFGAGGLGWFGSAGVGMAWPVSKDGGLLAFIEARQRFRFAGQGNAGFQISLGITIEGLD